MSELDPLTIGLWSISGPPQHHLLRIPRHGCAEDYWYFNRIGRMEMQALTN